MTQPTEQEAIDHGTVVDASGIPWQYDHDHGDWVRSDLLDSDPESWRKVSGNYGPVALMRCGKGHPTRPREPGEWMMTCGCVALDATDEAIYTDMLGAESPDQYRTRIRALGPSPS